MTEKLTIMPEIIAFADDDHDNYHIEIKLTGAEKGTIKLRMHEDSFFIKAESDNYIYLGSYAVCCEINPNKAKAAYNNGLLKIDVPFKDPMEGALEIKIE
jgi:HSP20 family protein